MKLVKRVYWYYYGSVIPVARGAAVTRMKNTQHVTLGNHRKKSRLSYHNNCDDRLERYDVSFPAESQKFFDCLQV